MITKDHIMKLAYEYYNATKLVRGTRKRLKDISKEIDNLYVERSELEKKLQDYIAKSQDPIDDLIDTIHGYFSEIEESEE
jgi:hypothetical protein